MLWLKRIMPRSRTCTSGLQTAHCARSVTAAQRHRQSTPMSAQSAVPHVRPCTTSCRRREHGVPHGLVHDFLPDLHVLMYVPACLPLFFCQFFFQSQARLWYHRPVHSRSTSRTSRLPVNLVNSSASKVVSCHAAVWHAGTQSSRLSSVQPRRRTPVPLHRSASMLSSMHTWLQRGHGGRLQQIGRRRRR